MDSPRFSRLRVSARREETAELTLLRLAGEEPSFFASHRSAGQYCALRLPEAEKPGYLAIASEPGIGCFEFLVRGGGRFAETLRSLQPGDSVDVSEALGQGFPVAESRGRETWLVAAGSGLAALRPVVRVLLSDAASTGPLHVLVGARDREAVPFRSDLEAWRRAGVDVTFALSRHLGGEEDGIAKGYVQDVLAQRAPDLSRAVVFVCGMNNMMDSVRHVAERLAHGAARVYTNH